MCWPQMTKVLKLNIPFEPKLLLGQGAANDGFVIT